MVTFSCAIPENIQAGGDWGHGISTDIEKIENGNSRGDREKIMWDFHWSWFLDLEIPMGVTQFSEMPRDEASLYLEFPTWVRWQI